MSAHIDNPIGKCINAVGRGNTLNNGGAVASAAADEYQRIRAELAQRDRERELLRDVEGAARQYVDAKMNHPMVAGECWRELVERLAAYDALSKGAQQP